jgi:transposase
LETQIAEREAEIKEMLYPSVERDLLDTLPCVGPVLSAVLALELGEVRRFPDPGSLASYAGLVPAARESAEWKKQDGCPRDCNVYLKWAYVEAANLIAAHRKQWSERHVVRLYERVRNKTRMHGKATMAVAHHLAEASWHMLSKLEVYREPLVRRPALSSTHG